MRDRTLHHLRLLHHVAILFLVGVGNAEQHTLETWTPVTIGRRKIRAPIKRLAIGRKKSGERPSALPADRTDRSLVPAVDIGTLVAIHLHRDEMFIHDGGNHGIVVGLAVHHMAPMAPHRPNVEQHGLVLAPRRGEGLLAPLVPLNWLVHGGTQVSGRGAREGVEGRRSHNNSSLNRFGFCEQFPAIALTDSYNSGS